MLTPVHLANVVGDILAEGANVLYPPEIVRCRPVSHSAFVCRTWSGPREVVQWSADGRAIETARTIASYLVTVKANRITSIREIAAVR